MHYRPNLTYSYVSEVDAPGFFLSKVGKESPDEELRQNIAALDSGEGQEYACKFPLRYKWLKSQVKGNWNYDLSKCAVYQSFIQKLDAKKITLVFSSYYINNPGSTFGHTFLRVSRYERFGTNELLDYAINFAAHETKDNAILYMLKGLGGFYPGRFSAIPYYYKIREYSDHEFRDVWDYDLGLTQDQVNRVVDHVWELAHSHFDYYYFTENCSYHILGLLNVAYDDVDLLAGLNPLYVVPIDTVKELKKLKLIRDRKVRRSAYGKLLKETQGMTAVEKDLVKKIATNPKEAKALTAAMDQEKSAGILDASISAIDYLKANAILKNEKKALEEKNELLITRAENPEISPDLDFSSDALEAPEESHDTARFGILAGERRDHGTFGGFELRGPQHELLDPSQGQLKNAQVIIGDARFRFSRVNHDREIFTLERLRFFDLKKYQPSDFWNDSVSWDLATGLEQRRDCISQNCLNPIATFGVGNSTAFTQDVLLTLLLGGAYQVDPIYQNDSLLSLGPKVNLLILKEKFSFGAEAGYFLPTELFDGWLKRRINYEADLRFFIRRNLSLFLKNNNYDLSTRTIHETQLGIYFYH